MKKNWFLLLASLLAVTLIMGGCGSQSKPAAKYPDKAMEFVVPYSAGGGSDIMARLIGDIALKNKFIDAPMQVVNKPGGSGAVGNAYVFSKKGDKYTLMTMNSGHALSALVNKAEVKAGMMTPIANLALDDALIAVKADSKYKTFEDLLKAVKEKPESVIIGGVGMGSEDHLCWGMINKETGTKFKWVSFNSSGDALSAVLGGHVDVGIFNPNEFVDQVKAGKMRPIASYSKKRLTGIFKDVPTFTELGFPNINFVQFRSVLGPPDMPKEAVKYWSDTFKKLTETEQWKKDYCDKFMLTNQYMDADTYSQFHKSEETRMLKIADEVGIVKK